jgi:hypothetical protein
LRDLKKIQEAGILWGVRNAPSRCTYLTPSKETAEIYGPVVLEVRYTPNPEYHWDNYIEDCDQLRVYVPLFLFRKVGG